MGAKRKKDVEFDLHVWKEPEDETMVALYTLSFDKCGICYHMPIEQAMEALREYLEEAE